MAKVPVLLVALLAGCGCLEAAGRKLLVLSVDGLDQRYLRDADRLGLRIPNMRRLVREGEAADGIIGVYPTVTWPSHTSIITGVAPHVHGILSNRRPRSEGGEYYWDVSLLKVPTLLDAVRKQGLKSAAITWPVTVNAPVDYNLPEYFVKRNGGGMDLESIEAKATPGLVREISAMYPSFAQEWMDDRTRAQATMFLLRAKKPDLILVHFVDHDAEAHENGPFSRAAVAKIEYTDELIGGVLSVLPDEYVVALVSDHGFERTNRIIDVDALVGGDNKGVAITAHVLTASTPAAADRIRNLARESKNGIGREIPVEELRRFTGAQFADAVAAWEPAEHVVFGRSGEKLREKGNHGFWPLRRDYRSVFVLWGTGIARRRLPEMPMTGIAARLAKILELPFSPN